MLILDRVESKGEMSPETNWAKAGFRPIDVLNNLGLPIIEVAGPTYRGFKLVDFNQRQVPMFASNLPYNHPEYRIASPQFQNHDLDFNADGRNLPFADNSVGAVAVSCIMPEVRRGVIYEARRVITPEGLLIWDGGVEADIKYALSLGLELCMYQVDKTQDGQIDRWHAIFQKS